MCRLDRKLGLLRDNTFFKENPSMIRTPQDIMDPEAKLKSYMRAWEGKRKE